MGLSEEQPWYEKTPGIYVSKPLAKIFFNNGLGFYILPSMKFFFIPRFYGMIHSTFWEFGIRVWGYYFEIMWNKHFKVK